MLAQQKSLANEEGFIEEMMEGTRLSKSSITKRSIDEFNMINEQLRFDGENASKYGNVLGPIMGNIGNLMYVVVAIIGGVLVTLGASKFWYIKFFLQLSLIQ